MAKDASSIPANDPTIDPFNGETIPVALRSNAEIDKMPFDELVKLLGDAGGIVHVTELDDRVRFAKEDLIGKPLIITGWKFSTGDLGTYSVCNITTTDNQHGFFADGSTGIRDQLQKWTQDMGGVRPIYAPKGLRSSKYMADDGKGNKIPAETFYISNEQ